ncbi:ATP-binding protein [Pirellulaceae bacterium SH501]
MESSVLLVEDDSNLRALQEIALRKAGFRVTACENFSAATVQITQKAFAVAVIDLDLPDQNGLGLIESLNKRSPTTRILICSAETRFQNVVRAIELQVFAYVEKTKGLLELVNQVNRAWASYLSDRWAQSQRDSLLQLNLLDAMDEFALAVDPMHRIVFANNAMKQFLGQSESEWMGTNVGRFISLESVVEHASRKLRIEILRSLANFDLWLGIVRMRCLQSSTKNEVLVDLRLKSFRDAKGALIGHIAIASNVEGLFRLQTKVAQQKEALFRAHSLSVAERIADSLSHEINQPLSAISNYLGGLQLDLDANRFDATEIRETIQLLQMQTARASGILLRLRKFLKREPIPFVEVDLRALVEETLQLFDRECQRLGVVIKTRFPTEPSICSGDFVQLQQVFSNILTNALESISSSPTRNRPEIVIRFKCEPPWIRIDIFDNGPGISESLLHSIFEPYVTTKPTGTGLGLSICREIIAAHEGSLSASRPRYGGFCITIRLPCSIESDL